MRNAYNIVVGKRQGKRLFGRFRRRWEYNIRMDLLGSNRPAIQLVRGALSPGLNWPGCEADHSLPSGAEVKN